MLTNVYGGFSSAGVAVSGSLAVASGGSLGMKVVDVSVPSAPRVSGALGGNIGGVALAGQHAYALLSVAGNPAHTDLQVVDLSNPAAPAVQAQITLAGGAGIKVSGGLRLCHLRQRRAPDRQRRDTGRSADRADAGHP